MPFSSGPDDPDDTSGISTGFPVLSRTRGLVIHVLRTRAPLSSPKRFSFDLHVLGPPQTFALSQDQTLQFDSCLHYFSSTRRRQRHSAASGGFVPNPDPHVDRSRCFHRLGSSVVLVLLFGFQGANRRDPWAPAKGRAFYLQPRGVVKVPGRFFSPGVPTVVVSGLMGREGPARSPRGGVGSPVEEVDSRPAPPAPPAPLWGGAI